MEELCCVPQPAKIYADFYPHETPPWPETLPSVEPEDPLAPFEQMVLMEQVPLC